MTRQDCPSGFGHPGLGAIVASLAAHSTRPRFAFLVLQLVAEVAGEGGTAGPFVRTPHGPMGLRDWLCAQLRPISEHNHRRAALRARVVGTLAGQLTGDPQRDEPTIEAAVEEQALTVARANLSRAITDLVKAGLLQRHYVGYATDHANRGGGRHAVYVVKPATLVALGKRSEARRISPPPRQGDLFAA
jgi:hypothetical protein